VAEREETRRLHVQILKALVERHGGASDAALPHARALVRIDGDETAAHVTLLRLLGASGGLREAPEQREVSARLLGEVRGAAAEQLAAAWRSLAAKAQPAVPQRASEHGIAPSPAEASPQAAGGPEAMALPARAGDTER